VKCCILPRLSAVFVALGALLLAIPASASAAANTGFVSLGNLSASPTPVDIYLYSSGDSSPQIVDPGVPYGTVLPYRQVKCRRLQRQDAHRWVVRVQ